MFDNYFVRVTFDLFRRKYSKFLDLKIDPEIYIDSETLNRITPAILLEMKEILSKFRCNTIHAPFLDISTGGYDKEIRDLSLKKLKKIIGLAQEWNSKIVVVHYNYDRMYYREYLDLWLNNAASFFRELSDYDAPPLIALENINDPTPFVALKLEEMINRKNIIHCFDFGHHNVFGEISFSEWLFYLRSGRHVHLHFHDNIGNNDDHLPVGEGNIRWDIVKDLLPDMKINFSVTLEPHSEKDMMKTLKNYRKLFLAS
ncbi:MAG: sugar phosphate isomerase/epimerase family protein [Acidobacteriota bacterium]